MIELMARRFGQFVSVLIFLSSPLLVLAQSDSLPSAQPKGESCFNYYQFQSVGIDLHGEKNIYKAGEGAKFLGSLTNKNNHPLVGGSLVLRLSKLDPRSQLGSDIISEWVAKDSINLTAGEKRSVSVSYQLPSGLPTGTYALTSYFLTQNKFNLSGLSFTDDIYGGYATFSVEGRGEKSIRFDRGAVKADGEPYRIFGFLPKIFPADTKNIAVSVPLRNETAKALKTDIKYELYAWDGVAKENLLKTWSESANLAVASSKTLAANLDVSSRPVYLLKIKVQAGDQEGEIHIRLVKEGFRPRLNDVGLTQFPLTGEEAATLFACYHNTTEGEGAGKLALALKSAGGGRLLAAAAWTGKITSQIDVFTKELPKTSLDNAVISAKLYDGKNNLVDEVEIPYDCSKFGESVCFKRNVNYYLLGGGVILIIAALYLIKKHFKKGKAPEL